MHGCLHRGNLWSSIGVKNIFFHTSIIMFKDDRPPWVPQQSERFQAIYSFKPQVNGIPFIGICYVIIIAWWWTWTRRRGRCLCFWKVSRWLVYRSTRFNWSHWHISWQLYYRCLTMFIPFKPKNLKTVFIEDIPKKVKTVY